MRGTVATFLVAGALVPVAGCGGDDAPITSVSAESTATTTAEGSSDEEFLTAADALCAEAYAAIANLTSETSTAQELSITEGLLDGLQGLEPPSDPALDSFFAALEDQVATLEEIEAATASGDTTTAASLEAELEVERSSALAAADEYGFDDCAQEGTSLPDDGTTTTGEPVTPAPSATTPAVPVTPTTTTPAPVPTTPAPAPVAPPDTGGGTAGGDTGGGTGSTGESGSSSGSGGIAPG
jgi:hypothetical protein